MAHQILKPEKSSNNAKTNRSRNVLVLILFTLISGFLLAAIEISNSKAQSNHTNYLPVITKPLPQFWARTYDIANRHVKFVAQAADNGYLIGGYISDDGSLVAKVSDHGDVVWSKSFAPASFNSGIGTNDGGAIIVGRFPGVVSYPFIVKVLSDGSIDWQKTYQNGYASLYDIHPTTDGGYVVAGILSGSYDAWVFKINAQGEIIWQKKYGDSNPASVIVGDLIHQTRDNHTLVLANTTLLKIDSAGGIVWQRRLHNIIFTEILEMTNGDILLTGYEQNSLFTTAIAFMLNPDGSFKWQKSWGRPAFFYGADLTSDGHVVLSGDAAGHGLLMKINSNGVVFWQKTYTGGTTSENFYKLLVDESDNIIAIGKACSFQDGGACPIWMWRLPSTGNLPDCNFVANHQVNEDSFAALIGNTVIENVADTAVTTGQAMVAPTDSMIQSEQVCP